MKIFQANHNKINIKIVIYIYYNMNNKRREPFNFNYKVHDDLCNLARQYETGLGYLRLYVSDPELKKKYKETVEKHNNNLFSDTLSDTHPNSGFDLYTPQQTDFMAPFQTQFVDLGVKCEMLYCNKDYICGYVKKEMCYVPTAFYMYPRSSISKTPLMLANHTGIIDSGYRGSLIAAVRYLPETKVVENRMGEKRDQFITGYTLEKDTRLFQICHPSLLPIYVEVLDENKLSETTRGEGGFGSTGK
jgi:dUTP pyrophosphatase